MASERAERGKEQVQRRGIDKATKMPRYYARFTVDGKRYHIRLRATTLDDARREMFRRKAEIENPRPVGDPTVTVRALAEKFCGKHNDWSTGHGAETKDPRHYRRQAWSVFDCHVLPTLGTRRATELRPGDVVRLRDAMLGKKQHKRTVQRALGHLSLLFSWAIENELIDCANPCSDVKKPSPKSRSAFYSEAEVGRILVQAAKHAPDLHGCASFAFYTGCRKGEIAALRVGDCDLEGGRIIVSRSWESDARKNGEAVTVQVHPHLEAILRTLVEGRGADELVFPDPRTGRMRDKFDSWGFDEILDLAKVPKPLRPWHSFRHSHGTALAASGAGLAEIQEALGQKTLEMARRYTRVAAAQVRARVHALPAIGPVLPAKVISLAARRERTPLGHGTERGEAKSSEPGGI